MYYFYLIYIDKMELEDLPDFYNIPPNSKISIFK